MVGVRIGCFDFGGDDTLLLDGDTEGLNALASALLVLVAGDQETLSLHRLAFVSSPTEVELNAHRSTSDIGISRNANVFQWRRSPRGWAGVVEQILGVAEHGRGHQYLDAPSDDVVVMVSSGEYGEPWPTWPATEGAK